MTPDPTHPVIVGAEAVANRTADGEPVAMMVEAAENALGQLPEEFRSRIESIRVVKGIWPYRDPGRLVGNELGLDSVSTAITPIGGNATYDLANRTAIDISTGTIGAAIICGAETMRTRRADKAAGRLSPYLPEADDASPDNVVGVDVELTDKADAAAGLDRPVNFYAMVESAQRHRRGETPLEHLERISSLWASGSDVAAENPDAWMTNAVSALDIATAAPNNRMVASPYTKLLTSNINVDQGGALVMCSYEIAVAAGLADDQMVFLLSGAGANDHLTIRSRPSLDESPALRACSRAALEAAGLTIDDVEHLDLYSCFPSAVQLARDELNIDTERPFTITGGLTFAGGPFNGYCTQALVRATQLLLGTSDRAFLTGNGGFFSKHSVLLVSGTPPATAYAYSTVQASVDALETRDLAEDAPIEAAVLEAYTVLFDRENEPLHGIASLLANDGIRHWAIIKDHADIDRLLTKDAVGSDVLVRTDPDNPQTPLGRLTSN